MPLMLLSSSRNQSPSRDVRSISRSPAAATQHRWVQEHITGRYRNTAHVGTGTQHRWVQEHSTGRYRNTAQTGTGTQHRQVQEQVGTGTQHRQVQERSTGRYRHMKTSDRARHFSNQCDIYKVASVVHRNNQTTTVIGQVHSCLYHYQSSTSKPSAAFPVYNIPSHPHTPTQALSLCCFLFLYFLELVKQNNSWYG